MPLVITEAAAEVLERAHTAAARFNPDTKIRVHRVGERIETGFAEKPEEGDEAIEHEGLTIYVAAGIDGTLDVSLEHDRLLVR